MPLTLRNTSHPLTRSEKPNWKALIPKSQPSAKENSNPNNVNPLVTKDEGVEVSFNSPDGVALSASDTEGQCSKDQPNTLPNHIPLHTTTNHNPKQPTPTPTPYQIPNLSFLKLEKALIPTDQLLEMLFGNGGDTFAIWSGGSPAKKPNTTPK